MFFSPGNFYIFHIPYKNLCHIKRKNIGFGIDCVLLRYGLKVDEVDDFYPLYLHLYRYNYYKKF